MNSLATKGSELRTAPRLDLSGAKPGSLRFAESGIRLTYKGVDISRGGLGILTNDEVDGEKILLLEIDGVAVELEIVWISPASGWARRLGLRVTNPTVDLTALAVVGR